MSEVIRLAATDRGGVEQDLRQLEKRHDDLVRVISHDLRSPLTAVLMQSELLRRQSSDPGSVERRAAAIIASATRLNAMIQDLVDADRLERGKLQLECQPLELRSFIPELLLSLRGTLTVERVDLRMADELPSVVADPRRLGRVLTHLVDNALKFSPPDCRVTLSAAAQGDKAVAVSVTDRGRGIPPEELPGILENRPKSRSLGIQLTEALVRAHGGTLGIDSRPGEGTTVTVTLRAAQRQRPKQVALTPVGGIPVLLVDDDGDSRRAMAGALREHGFEVTEAAEGEDALAQAQRRPPAAAVMDLIMPGMDGWSLLEAMQRDPVLQHVPVVVISAQTAFDAGIAPPAVAAFLEKPLDIQTLCATVQQAVTTFSSRHQL